MPQIYVDFPEEDEEREILTTQVPFAEDEVVDYVLSFLRVAHQRDLRYTVRDGINLVRYAMKVLRRNDVAEPARAVRRAMKATLEEDELQDFEIEIR